MALPKVDGPKQNKTVGGAHVWALASAGISVFSCPGMRICTTSPPSSQIQTEFHHELSWDPSLQVAAHGSPQPP